MITEDEIRSQLTREGGPLRMSHPNGNTYVLLSIVLGKTDAGWVDGVLYQALHTQETYWRPINEFSRHTLIDG